MGETTVSARVQRTFDGEDANKACMYEVRSSAGRLEAAHLTAQSAAGEARHLHNEFGEQFHVEFVPSARVGAILALSNMLSRGDISEERFLVCVRDIAADYINYHAQVGV